MLIVMSQRLLHDNFTTEIFFTLQDIFFNCGRFISVHRMLHGSAEGRGLDSRSRTNA